MARIIVGGAAEFDALAYGKPHIGTIHFLQSHLNQYSNTLTEAGQRWYEGVKGVFAQVDQSEAMRAARAIGRRIATMWDIDMVREISDIAGFQHAGLKMQRWVMAEPTVRALYHTQGCDGYSESYVDVSPGMVGDHHYDYRRVMHGMVMDDPEGDWKATSYLEELLPEDQDLMMDEQVDILMTWEHLKSHLNARKDDPTSRWNAEL